MSVEQVYAALATIEAGIAIVPPVTLTVFSAPPNSISGNIPCIVNLFGDSTVDMQTTGEDIRGLDATDLCIYTATLYTADQAKGVPGEAFNTIGPWIEPAALIFLAHPSVGLLNGKVVMLEYLGHGRPRGDLSYGGQLYYGVEFRLRIRTRMRATYAANE